MHPANWCSTCPLRKTASNQKSLAFRYLDQIEEERINRCVNNMRSPPATKEREPDMTPDEQVILKINIENATTFEELKAATAALAEQVEYLSRPSPCCAGGPYWGHAWDCPKVPD